MPDWNVRKSRVYTIHHASEYGQEKVVERAERSLNETQPYVDVRSNLNSLLPASLSDDLGEKLVIIPSTGYEKDYLHDKYEFSCSIYRLHFDPSRQVDRRRFQYQRVRWSQAIPQTYKSYRRKSTALILYLVVRKRLLPTANHLRA